MADDTKAQIEPESDTQGAPMPDAEQKTPAPEESEEAASGDSPEEADADTKGLPDDATERTREQFDKLRNQLKDERTRREYFETVFNSMQTKQQSEGEAPEPIYDPDTGLLNEQAITKLQQEAQEAKRQAADAEKRVSQYVQDQEDRDAYTAHPELNPNDKKRFSKDLHVETRRILLDSMLNPTDYGKRQLSFKEAGDLAKTHMSKVAETAKKEGAQQAVEQLTPKEQAALEAVGTPGRRSEAMDNLSELRQRTRKGDPDALAERVKATLGEQE